MTPHQPVGQDASVAVLQVQIQQQQSTMAELARSVTDGMANLSAKVDRLSEVATTIAAISERMASHSDGLQRAFTEVRNLHERLTEHLEESGQWREAMTLQMESKLALRDKRIDEAKATIGTWRGIVIGFMAAAGLAGGAVTFMAGKYVSSTEANADAIHDLELKVNQLPYAVERRP